MPFLQDIDNTLYRKPKLWDIVLRNVPPGYHKGSILNVWLYVCLHIQDSQAWKIGDNESYRKGENKKVGEMENAGCLCRCVKLSSPQMHQYHTVLPQRWGTKVIYWGGGHSIYDWQCSHFVVCFYGQGKEGVSDVLWLCYAGCWLMIILYT